MKNNKWLLLIIILSLSLIITGCDNNTNTVNEETFSVSGRVINLENQGMEDVTLHFTDFGTATTNSDGYWEKNDLSGEVTITPSKDGYKFDPLSREVTDSEDNIEFTGYEDYDLGENEYLLKGRFANSEVSGQMSTMESNNVVSEIVLVYAYDYEVVEVNEDGTFAIPMRKDEPGGLAFVDDTGNYISSLDLGDGLGSIPSQSLKTESNLVDLGLINEDGTLKEYIITEDFDISDSDLDAVAVADTFFSAVAMNKDMVEKMTKENKKIRIFNTYFISHSRFDDNNELNPNNLNKEIKAHRIGFWIDSSFSYPSDMKLTYPSNGLENETSISIPDEWNEGSEYNEDNIHFPGVGGERGRFIGEPIPQPGEYRLFNDTSGFDISFELPDIRSAATENLVVPVPEVTIDSDGILQSISWVFHTVSGDIIDDPNAIIADGSIGFSMAPKYDGDYNIVDLEGNIVNNEELKTDNQYLNDGRFHDEYHMNIGDEISVSNKEIYWQDVSVMDISYEDRYGILYMVPYINNNYNPLDSAYEVKLSGETNVVSDNISKTVSYLASLDYEVEAPVVFKLNGEFENTDIDSINKGSIDALLDNGVEVMTDSENGEVVLEITFAPAVNKSGKISVNISKDDENIVYNYEDNLNIEVNTTGN